VMLGGDVTASNPTDVASTVAVTAAAGATSVTLASAAGLAVGDLLVIYPKGFPELVSVLEISAITGAVVDFLTGQVTQHTYTIGGSNPVVHAFKAQPIAIGSLDRTNYFSMMLVQQDNRTGRPAVASFWKGAISGNVDLANNSQDFASSKMDFKILRPALSEYSSGGALYPLRNIIPTHKSGFVDMGGADNAVIV